MGDLTSLDPNDNQEQQGEPDLDNPKGDVADEAAEQFARLFLSQCLHEKREKEDRHSN